MSKQPTSAKDITLPVKRTTGETLEERLTDNAYHNILPARYLQKDADGNLIEEQEDLFERVARNVALAEAVYAAEHHDIEVTVTPAQLKPDHPRRDELASEVFGAGTTADDEVETALTEHNVNKFAYETVVPELPDPVREHVEEMAESFQDAMEDLSFIPNSPTLMNAGGELQQLSACFVMSPDDDISDIHETAKQAAEVFQSGGGVGYGFWKLRPYGDSVGSTGGIASGPITFMRTFDQLCETIAQGGTRRGAQMAIMRVSHPDVIEFIHAKNKDVSLAHSLKLNDPDDYTYTSFSEALAEARELIDEEGRVPKHLRNAVEGHLSNFNISVGVTDGFMEAVKAGEDYTFTNPRTGEPHVATEETKEMYGRYGLGEHVEVGEELSIPAELVWDRIIQGAHENGEPGVVFLERINKEHSFDVEEHPDHRILATNPCGEQPLEEYEACNLGHINLSTLAAEGAPDWRVWSERHGDDYETQAAAIEAFLESAIDWDEFDRRIELATRFLENVVTMSDFPVAEIEETVHRMRKIGLGIMGLAQLYIQLGMRYGSDASNEVARQLMTHINHGSKWTSHELAGERGTFAEWDDSKYADPVRYRDWFEHQTGLDADEWADGFPIRNHNSTTIAPTGCIEENSLVSTSEGLQPIKNLDETSAEFEQWNDIEVGVSTDGGTKTATAIYDNGFDAVKTIRTETGFNVTATPNHKFRVLTEDNEYRWREARNVLPGDSIVLARNSYIGRGEPSLLDASESEKIHFRSDQNLQLPEKMSPELATLLGFYVGDGHLNTTNGVELAVDSEYPETVEQLIELGEHVFGVRATTEEKTNCILVSIGGQHVTRFFKDNGWVKKSRTAFIPDEVLDSGEEIARAFLRGLFEADGTASRKVELATSSEVLSKQVQTVLLSLGLVFKREEKLHTVSGYNSEGDEPYFVLRGLNKAHDKKFLEEIGFLSKTTSIELTENSYRKDTYPPNVVDVIRETDGYSNICERSLKAKVNDAKRRNGLTHNLLQQVEERLETPVTIDGRELSSLFIDTVESIDDDTAYTKDISVPENNTYVANGFVTHNTTSMVGNTTGGCEPIYNVAYYKNVTDDVQGDEMLVEFDDYFLRTLEANDIDVEAVKAEAQEQMANNVFAGIEGLETVPDAIGELFVVTGDLSANEHAAVQTACQAGVDSAISKTVNAPNDSTVEDAKAVFESIYDDGGKGVTYYRDGTRSKQVLTTRADNADFADLDDDEAVEALLEQLRDVFGSVEGFLDHESVQAELADSVDTIIRGPDSERYAKKRPRPDVLHGTTQRIETGYGKLYVNINEDEDGRPFELFATIGNSGGFTASFTEALAKTISAAMRAGVDPNEIAGELQGIRSPKVAWDKGEQINSIPDAIGTAMRRYLNAEIDRPYPEQPTLEEATAEAETTAGTTETDDNQDVIAQGESPECPDCGSFSLYYAEGCKTCDVCGWSEC